MKRRLALFGGDTEALGPLQVHVFLKDDVSGSLIGYQSYPNLWAFYLSCDRWGHSHRVEGQKKRQVFTEFLCALIVSPNIQWMKSGDEEASILPHVWRFLTQKSSASTLDCIQNALNLGAASSKSEFLFHAKSLLLALIQDWAGWEISLDIAIGSSQAEEILEGGQCTPDLKKKAQAKLLELGYFQTIWQIGVEDLTGEGHLSFDKFGEKDLGETVFVSESSAKRSLFELRHKLEGLCADALTVRTVLVRYDGLVKGLPEH